MLAIGGVVLVLMGVVGVVVLVVATRQKADPVPQLADAGVGAPAPVASAPVNPRPAVGGPSTTGPSASTPNTTGPTPNTTGPTPNTQAPRPNPSPPPPVGGQRLDSSPKGPVGAGRALVMPEGLLGPVSSPPPKIQAATLVPSPDSPPLDVPSFYSLQVARQATKTAPKASKLTLDEVKQATVYIKVEAGEVAGSGSGFLIGVMKGEAFIATNHHVIEAALGGPDQAGGGSRITVVFNSGVPGAEVERVAKVMAFDPIADLAVLRVAAPPQALRVIDPWMTPKQLLETTDVRICGFPFGAQLATGGVNPSISISTGSISSLRTNKGGKLEQVQINGAINPGNSGGPVVDKDGRLVGITVATILNSGLGFAVPVNDLIALLEGRLLVTAFIPTGLQAGKATFQVIMPIMDPLDKIDTVYIRYWAGQGPRPKGLKDPKIGWKPIQPAEQLKLEVPSTPSSLTVVGGELSLPTDVPEVVLQVASENKDKMVAASPPVSYKVTLTDIETGSDARPFTALTTNPEALIGKTIVVRGRLLGPPVGRAEVQELPVADLNGARAGRMRFLTTRDMATQFDEVVTDDQSKPVRLTCVVGARGDDGVVPVRVARVDFLGQTNRVVRSIPGPEPTDPLALLNRDPGKFAGKELDVKSSAVPLARAQPKNSFVVLFPHFSRPRNLAFVLPPALAEKVANEKFTPNGIYRTRLAVTVGPAPAQPGEQTQVTVRKIDILDSRDDSVLKTIE